MKTSYSFLSIRDRILTKKQVLRTLLFSLVLVGSSQMLAKACVIGHEETILLNDVFQIVEEIPKQLEQATFKGDIELTRVNRFRSDTVIIRAIVHESDTHPQFVGKKMMLFYDSGICHYNISRVGDRGLARGRALKLGSEVLYVVPYVLTWKNFEDVLLIEDESIPLREFYPDGY